eukprot:CAMPEP_0113664684 /NCGR_PEP_ID=MMETSP0038_2-20120614/1874_1 /TAXON_ID=2898 /ORGANISM="Cryptomonas paramecium" /LENGTH=198 /DNA_ID=CAMNT_0000579929 /DNA_START=141 /DNA_END=734 /DNA_ORIENTATION=+ /assembly_acc=CAM_ASM_000170
MSFGSSQLVWQIALPNFEEFSPDVRCKHTLTLVPPNVLFGSALLFGGRVLNGQPSNELYILEIGDLNHPNAGNVRWIQQPLNPHSIIPEAREGHSACIFRKYFVIFGGLGLPGLLNDVCSLDLETWEWSKPDISGIPPLRRHNHTGCQMDQRVVIFGGFSEHGDCENDVAILDMESWAWSIPAIAGEPPPPRMDHSAT